MSSRELRPTQGARFLLERAPIAREVPTDAAADAAQLDAQPETSAIVDGVPVAGEPTTAAYRAVIFTPDAEFATTVTLGEDGSVALAGPTGAPGDLDDRLTNMAKLVARDAPKRREDGLAVWPARILRWRK